MLAELAAANAAFAVIKKAVQNSGDLARAGGAIAKFVGAKEGLEKKVAGKNRSTVGGSADQGFGQIGKTFKLNAEKNVVRLRKKQEGVNN